MKEETKLKISKTLKGRMPKFIPDNTGRKHTKETKEKIANTKRKNPTNYWLGKKRPMREDIKKKISTALKGEKSYLWKGGITYNPYSVDWTRTLKRSIRERDNYICQICNQYGYAVHHIDYNKENCNPNNLITLCIKCHAKTNQNRSYWIDYFYGKRTNP